MIEQEELSDAERVSGWWIEYPDPVDYLAAWVASGRTEPLLLMFEGDRYGCLRDRGALLALIIADWSFHELPVPRMGDVRGLELIPWAAVGWLYDFADEWSERITKEALAMGVLAGSVHPPLTATSTGFAGVAR